MCESANIVIVDYGAGNLESVVRAFARAGAAARITADAAAVSAAQAIVLPGVGAFDTAMARLQDTGIDTVLRERVAQGHTPVLGICLGFQMFTRASAEGRAAGFAWIDGESQRFPAGPETPVKVPHIGWNDVLPQGDSPLFRGLGARPCFYFAHSYYVDCLSPAAVVAETDYGRRFTAVVQQGPLVGVQFHPEKSHDNGARFLRNFLEMNGLA